MKRTFCAFLALLLLLLSVPSVAADDPAAAALIEGCYTEDYVDLEEYRLTEDALDELFYALRDGGKMPWYTDYGYTYYVDAKGIVTSYKPDTLDPELYDREAYELALGQLIDKVVFPGMTPVEIALAVHDHLITHCAYDESLHRNTGYDLLIHGSTVCAGYSELYMDILNRLGIPCVCVSSDGMDHAWNLVYLNDAWYHVDITWDDPTPDTHGTAEHTYFLLTDAQILTEGDGHSGWETDIVCDGEPFTDAFWREVESPVCFTGAQQCVFRRDTDFVPEIYAMDLTNGETTLLYRGQEEYVDVGHGEYAYATCGLSLCAGRLWFSDMTTLWSMTPEGKDLRREYTQDVSTGRFLHGSFVEAGQLYCSLSDHDFELTEVQVELPGAQEHVHVYETTDIAPTCTAPGQTLYRCGCGDSHTVETEPPADHSYSFALETPGRTGDGALRLSCTGCEQQLILPLPRCLFIRTWLRLS